MTQVDADTTGSPYANWAPNPKADRFVQMRRRLRLRLLVAYITPLVVLSIFFNIQYVRTVRESIDAHLRSIAENQRNTVDLFLQERVSNLRHLFLQHSPAALTQENLESILRQLGAESPAFVDVGLFNPQGRLVAYAGSFSFLLGKSYEQESWYQATLGAEKNYFISDVFLGYRQRPHFIVAVRKQVNNETWVLRASVDPQRFGAFVHSSHLLAEGDAFIVNAKGIRQTVAESEQMTSVIEKMPERSAHPHITELTINKVPQLAAFSWLKEIDWALIVSVPIDTAEAPLWQALGISGAVMVVALGIIVFLVLRATRRLIDKLETSDHDKIELRGHLLNAAKLASVGEMAAGVAHEINNPLAIIYEEAGMMKDILDPEFGKALDPKDFGERLTMIMDAAIRGRTITRNLMAFARKHDPVMEPTNLNTVVERNLDVKRNEFNVSNIEVQKHLSPLLPRVKLNANQMDQVLLNLLNNAKDAIRGEGVITVTSKEEDGWVVLSLADTGCGMDEQQMEKVFYPFFTTKPVGKGTGLGLSISYGIIKSFGGRIEVQSQKNRGTTFTIYLPISDYSNEP